MQDLHKILCDYQEAARLERAHPNSPEFTARLNAQHNEKVLKNAEVVRGWLTGKGVAAADVIVRVNNYINTHKI